MAEILRSWRALRQPGSSQHTVAWLSRESGVGKREIRRILTAGTGTTSEHVFDRLMTAIGRYDLFFLLERVEDGRSAANRQRKFSCAPARTPAVA